MRDSVADDGRSPVDVAETAAILVPAETADAVVVDTGDLVADSSARAAHMDWMEVVAAEAASAIQPYLTLQSRVKKTQLTAGFVAPEKT